VNRSVPPRSRPSGVVAVAVAAVLLAGCGGEGDAPVAADDEPVSTVAPTDTAASEPAPAAVDGPLSTVPADVPEEFIGSIGPVDVTGDSLPELPIDPTAPDPAVGMQVPVLVGVGFDGQPVRIDPAAEGPTVVAFLAHWCPHCNDEIPVINELRDDALIPAGVSVVAVSTAVDPGRPNFPPAEWLADKGWTFPAMADGVDVQRQTFIAADAYGLTAFPFVAFVDGDGRVVRRWSGEHTVDEWVAALDALVAG
jgi:thiol-disulfide isomerase/thioredoxin